jgi:predicted transcriptional regulator
MSRVEMAVEKVRRLNENQAEALLEWLDLRENREALRKHLDAEIDVGLQQLKEGRKISNTEVHAEIRARSQQRRGN